MGSDSGGRLFVLATPIGNLEDLTFRAVRILGELDALACEDTRRTRKILERHSIRRPRLLLSYHEHNEARAGRQIEALLAKGLRVGLCSNSGYPGISDPGYRIISSSRQRGYPVEVIPGAGAVTTALVASGLPSSSYTFLGFPPRKSSARRRILNQEKNHLHTLVLFEAPHRIGSLLKDAEEVLGNRLCAVCIELTKKFEQVHRGYLADLQARFKEGDVKGEMTVVIAGNNRKFIKKEGRDE